MLGAGSVFAIFFGLTTVSLIVDIAQGAAVSASADVVAAGLLWLVALGALVLSSASGPRSHYRKPEVGPRRAFEVPEGVASTNVRSPADHRERRQMVRSV